MQIHDEISRRRRLAEFAGPIGLLAQNNPIMERVLMEYAYGNIITKEEALSRMVVMLATDWQEQQKRAFELAQCGVVPVVQPPR